MKRQRDGFKSKAIQTLKKKLEQGSEKKRMLKEGKKRLCDSPAADHNVTACY